MAAVRRGRQQIGCGVITHVPSQLNLVHDLVRLRVDGPDEVPAAVRDPEMARVVGESRSVGVRLADVSLSTTLGSGIFGGLSGENPVTGKA